MSKNETNPITNIRRATFLAYCDDEIQKWQSITEHLGHMDAGVHTYFNKIDTLMDSKDKFVKLDLPFEVYPDLYQEMETWKNRSHFQTQTAIDFVEQHRETSNPLACWESLVLQAPGFRIAMLIDLGDNAPVIIQATHVNHEDIYNAASNCFGSKIVRIISGYTNTVDGQNHVQLSGFNLLTPEWTTKNPNGCELRAICANMNKNGLIQVETEQSFAILGARTGPIIRLV